MNKFEIFEKWMTDQGTHFPKLFLKVVYARVFIFCAVNWQFLVVGSGQWWKRMYDSIRYLKRRDYCRNTFEMFDNCWNGSRDKSTFAQYLVIYLTRAYMTRLVAQYWHRTLIWMLQNIFSWWFSCWLTEKTHRVSFGRTTTSCLPLWAICPSSGTKPSCANWRVRIS